MNATTPGKDLPEQMGSGPGGAAPLGRAAEAHGDEIQVLGR